MIIIHKQSWNNVEVNLQLIKNLTSASITTKIRSVVEIISMTSNIHRVYEKKLIY